MFSLHDLFPTTSARAAADRYAAPLARCREILAALRDETDTELRERVEALRAVARRAKGNRFHPKAVALIAEAVRRTHGLAAYDVQLLAGLVLADGQLAEMATGEGKTLVALLPAFCHAL